MINQRPTKTRPPSTSTSSSSSSASSSSPTSPNVIKSHQTLNKMGRRSILKPTLAAVVLLLVLYAFFKTSLFPNTLDNNLLFDTHNNAILKLPQKSVKIYMYDLPRKFTYGVIENYANARGGSIKEDELKYPGNQHPAEWHLFADLNNVDRSDSYVTRVMDPDQADLFYVPFFSSLSLVANPVRAGEVAPRAGYSDEQTQEALMKWLEEHSQYWKRNNGRDHVFICQDPNALYKVVDRVKNGVLLVSDFGRLGRDQASLVKDVILPYSHRINTYKGEVGVENRKSLMFFMGNRYRKEGGKIRDLLFQILEKEEDVVIKHGAQSRESRRMATRGMHSSKFCLHPAGDTPSACRLFDAIVSLCVPVIISDFIELPFEDVIDYRKISVFVDTSSAVRPGYLVKLLRGVSAERILEFQEELKKVRHYFEYDDPDGTVKEIWRQVSLKLPLIKLMINRDKRIVKRQLTEPDCSCLCSNQTGFHNSL